MDKQQLQQQIDDMKAKLAEIEALLNQPVINYWQPEEGEFYFFLDNFNTINKIRRASDGLNETRYRVFKTEKEAEKYAKYSEAEETLRKAIAEANKGWCPDWNDNEAAKTHIYLCNFTKKLITETGINHKALPNFMYIKSREIASDLMETYKQEFLIYLSY